MLILHGVRRGLWPRRAMLALRLRGDTRAQLTASIADRYRSGALGRVALCGSASSGTESARVSRGEQATPLIMSSQLDVRLKLDYMLPAGATRTRGDGARLAAEGPGR